jgi:hypothetical protein
MTNCSSVLNISYSSSFDLRDFTVVITPVCFLFNIITFNDIKLNCLFVLSGAHLREISIPFSPLNHSGFYIWVALSPLRLKAFNFVQQ